MEALLAQTSAYPPLKIHFNQLAYCDNWVSYEAVIQMEKTVKNEDQERQNWLNRNVAAMGLTSLLGDAGHEMVTAVLPLFLVVLGAGPEVLGLIEGFSDGASSLVKSFSGYLSDKIGKRKPVMNIG